MGAIWHTSNRWRINELEDIDTTSSKMFADITDNPDAFPHEANIWYWYDGGWTESNDIHVSLFPEGKSHLRRARVCRRVKSIWLLWFFMCRSEMQI